MSTLLLIRHASCEGLGVRLNGRGSGVSLSGEGRVEAERLASSVLRFSPHLLMTSPRERCRETADALASKIRAPVEIDEDLDEVDFGAWTGLSFDQLAWDANWREWNERRSLARAPQGESMAEVQHRMNRALKAAAKRTSGGVVALVGHAEPIRAAVAYVLGFSLDAWARLEISPASVTQLIADTSGLRVRSVNETLS